MSFLFNQLNGAYTEKPLFELVAQIIHEKTHIWKAETFSNLLYIVIGDIKSLSLTCNLLSPCTSIVDII